MIRAQGLRITAPGALPRPHLLDGIDLNIRFGEYVVLVGPNGAGKSLLLRVLAGLQAPTSGSIIFDEANGLRPGIGFVFQNPDDQIVGSTVERDLAFGLENRGIDPPEIRRRVDATLDWARLREVARRPPHLLSDGEKQRLALASALILEPELLFLDEPTSRLDPVARDLFLEELGRVRTAGRTTFVHATHREREAALGDRVVAMAQGRVVADVSPEEIVGTPRAGELGLAPAELPPNERPSRTVPASAGEPLVRAENVSFRAEPAGVIVDDISLTIRPGESLGVVGSSGAGKTTLLLLLAGLLEPSSGRVVHESSDRSSVGLVFQEPERAFFEPTVLEDVAFGARNRGCDPDSALIAARDALERVGLDPDTIGPRTPETLSGGEARRAAIAGILAFAPRVVLFDEPTIGLDADGLDRFRTIRRRLSDDGVATALVSHDLPLVVAECDRVVKLRKGRIESEGAG